MIKISITKNTETIKSVVVKGHAGYGDSGEDIVCAGISILTITILNGLSEIIGIPLEECIVDEGYTAFTVPELTDHDKKLQVYTLLETYELGIRATENAYGDYVKVIENNTGGELND